MAKGNQMADTSGRRKGAKMEDKAQIQSTKGKNDNSNNNKKKKSNSSNGTDDENKKDEPEVLVVLDSSADSKNSDGDEEDEAVQVQDSGEDDEEEGEEDGEEEEAKSSGITNQRSNKAKNGGENERDDATKKNKNKNKNGKNKKNESAASHCFPMHRISRIVKSEDPDIRIAQEAVFLINKASEKFLEVFCKEAYACAFLDHKNQVWYKHLSSVVDKRRRFDFLSDFVPEKVKAEDASAEETSIAET